MSQVFDPVNGNGKGGAAENSCILSHYFGKDGQLLILMQQDHKQSEEVARDSRRLPGWPGDGIENSNVPKVIELWTRSGLPT